MIGMREQEPENRADTSSGRSDHEGHRREAQQAATFCDLFMVVFIMHDWLINFREPSQGAIFAEISGECPEKNAPELE